jgi:hypothetical protein
LIVFAFGEETPMSKLAEIRNEELMCRERALSDPERSEFWLAKAEEWGQRALDEIAFQFRESSDAAVADAATNAIFNEGAHA